MSGCVKTFKGFKGKKIIWLSEWIQHTTEAKQAVLDVSERESEVIHVQSEQIKGLGKVARENNSMITMQTYYAKLMN